MKLIVAIIRPNQLTDVKRELLAADVRKMTVTQVLGCGQQGGYSEDHQGDIIEVNLLQKVRLEIAVNEDFVKPTIEAIIKGAQTGSIGDGKIFVLDLPQCIRIRTREEGSIAIG